MVEETNQGGAAQGGSNSPNNDAGDMTSMFQKAMGHVPGPEGAAAGAAANPANNDPGQASGQQQGAGAAANQEAAEKGATGAGAAPKSQAGAEGNQNDDTVFTKLREITGGKVNSKEELAALLNRPDLSQFPSLQKRLEFLEKGGDEETFNKILTMQPDKLSSEQLVKEKLRREYPKASTEDIDFMFNRQYKLDDSQFDEAEIRESKIRLDRDADQAKALLQEEVQKLSVPASFKEKETLAAQQKQAAEQWQGFVNKTLPTFKNVKLDLGEGRVMNYDVPDNERAEMQKQLYNMKDADFQFWAPLSKGADGNFDVNKFYQNVFFARNSERIMKALATHSWSNGFLDFRGTVQNSQDFRDGATQGGAQGNQVKTQGKAMLDSMKQNGLM